MYVKLSSTREYEGMGENYYATGLNLLQFK
jgi:hypothetical protein